MENGTVSEEVIPSNNQTGFPKGDDISDDFQEGIQQLAKERNLVITPEGNAVSPEQAQESTPEAPTPQPEVTQEATPEPSTTEEAVPEVPEKFQAKDGSVDIAKVEKSTVNAEEALAKYVEIERKLGQKRAEVQKQQSQPQVPQQAQTDKTMAQQIEENIKLYGVGDTLVKVMAAAKEWSGQGGNERIDELAQRLDAGDRRAELTRIAKEDGWVLSPEGIDAMSKFREQNPYLNGSPSPWQSTYEAMKGRGLVPENKSKSQVATPNPTPKGAPTTPPSGAAQTKTPSKMDKVDLDNPRELNKVLDTMTPEEQSKFFVSQGLPPL